MENKEKIKIILDKVIEKTFSIKNTEWRQKEDYGKYYLYFPKASISISKNINDIFFCIYNENGDKIHEDYLKNFIQIDLCNSFYNKVKCDVLEYELDKLGWNLNSSDNINISNI